MQITKPLNENEFNHRLADTIRKYWTERGHYVRVHVELTRATDPAHWEIRSDLLNGLPRDFSMATKGSTDGRPGQPD